MAAVLALGCADSTRPLEPDVKLAKDLVASVQTVPFSLTPQQTFLRTDDGDASIAPLVVDLTSLGIRPGSEIRIERLGDWSYSVATLPDNATALHAIFSSSNTVLPPTVLNRVPGAVSAGISSLSPPTLFGNLPTDIVEDFSVGDLTINVPSGASYLIVGVPDSWYQDNGDPNGNLGVRLSFTPPCVDLRALSLVPSSVVGGAEVTGTVRLGSDAPLSGQEVILAGETKWLVTLNVPAPQTVSLPPNVTVSAGQDRATFSLTTSAVNYPLRAVVTARSCGSTHTVNLDLAPAKIPVFGSAANARVQAIIDQFMQLGSFNAAWADALLLRNSNLSLDINSDIYLAAAEHYLYAAQWVYAQPSLIRFVAGFVPAYEVAKIVKLLDSPSEPTLLSTYWGERGVVAAIVALFGDVLRGGRW
jgi:hypothetical protein